MQKTFMHLSKRTPFDKNINKKYYSHFYYTCIPTTILFPMNVTISFDSAQNETKKVFFLLAKSEECDQKIPFNVPLVTKNEKVSPCEFSRVIVLKR